jgi:hypothetical protein
VRLVKATFALGHEPEELVKLLYSFAELKYESKAKNLKNMAIFGQKQADRLQYANLEFQERSLEALRLGEKVSELERKLRNDYPEFGLQLYQKDKQIKEAEAKIKKMEAERPPS